MKTFRKWNYVTAWFKYRESLGSFKRSGKSKLALEWRSNPFITICLNKLNLHVLHSRPLIVCPDSTLPHRSPPIVVLQKAYFRSSDARPAFPLNLCRDKNSFSPYSVKGHKMIYVCFLNSANAAIQQLNASGRGGGRCQGVGFAGSEGVG
jgi:hypothetical protein